MESLKKKGLLGQGPSGRGTPYQVQGWAQTPVLQKKKKKEEEAAKRGLQSGVVLPACDLS
jgi:hypothetical protein